MSDGHKLTSEAIPGMKKSSFEPKNPPANLLTWEVRDFSSGVVVWKLELCAMKHYEAWEYAAMSRTTVCWSDVVPSQSEEKWRKFALLCPLKIPQMRVIQIKNTVSEENVPEFYLVAYM